MSTNEKIGVVGQAMIDASRRANSATNNSAPVEVKKEPRKTKRVAPHNLARLSMRENHSLVTWLLQRKMEATDTVESLAASAAAELGIPLINANHIKNRLDEFDIRIPVRLAPASISELEQVLHVLVEEHIRLAQTTVVNWEVPLILRKFSGRSI